MDVVNDNNHKLGRRSVLKTTGIAGLSAIPFISGTTIAQSGNEDVGEFGYKINDNGFIEYDGLGDADYIEENVEEMNKAKKEGELDFEMRNGQVHLVNEEATSNLQPSQVPSPPGGGCAGDQGFSTGFHPKGTKFTIEMDSCTVDDVIDVMIAGAAAAQISAVITGAMGMVPAAAASQCAAILLAAGWQILDNNANGAGVVITWIDGSLGGFPSFGIDPQY